CLPGTWPSSGPRTGRSPRARRRRSRSRTRAARSSWSPRSPARRSPVAWSARGRSPRGTPSTPRCGGRARRGRRSRRLRPRDDGRRNSSAQSLDNASRSGIVSIQSAADEVAGAPSSTSKEAHVVRTRTTSRTRTAAVQVTALAAASALALSACGGGSTASAEAAPVATDRDIQLSLVWWGDDDRAGRYEEAVALFEEKYPNIDVQTQFQAWDDYWTARSTEAAGQTLPDVMQMDLAYIHQYASNNQLLDLSDQLGVNLDTDGYDDGLLASGAVNDGQYGIPTSTNTLGMIVHQDILDELGVDAPEEGLTWDEYDAWVREVSEAGADAEPRVYGGTDYTGTLWLFIQWLLQQGKTAFNDDGTPAFAEEDLVAWVERTQPLRDDGVFYPVERTKQVEPLTGLQVNEAATEM